ncbi:MAG: hypothetical protein U1D67_03360 [Dehalococcoidia bacterium]|nr:hypothetical protein [Dehalococcoidia bacterium]MDZ4246139.1 hypothetical protein [Dehalococcoidia bacterium]
MCRTCGCADYIDKGKKAVLDRATEIIHELGVTPQNASLYEDGEYICNLVGPMVSITSEDNEVWDIVKMMHEYHEGITREKRQTALVAVKDVFAHFPVTDSPRKILTMWHQLEQLQREISDADINSLTDPIVREALRTMRRVHDRSEARKIEMIEKYNLKFF